MDKGLALKGGRHIQAWIRNVYLRLGEGMDNYMTVPARELEWVQDSGGGRYEG